MNKPTKFRAAGFTMVELLVTMSVFAILVAIAAPQVRGFIVSNRLTSTANGVLGALGLARAEAIRRNQRVVLCPIDVNNGAPDVSACLTPGTASWKGWMVFVDSVTVNGNYDNGEAVLRADALPGGETKVLASSALSGSPGTSRIVFRPDGLARPLGSSSLQSFALGVCDVSANLNEPLRTIQLEAGSRMGVERGAATSCSAPSNP